MTYLRTCLCLAAVAACGSDEGRPDRDLGQLVVAPSDEPPAIDIERVTSDRKAFLTAATMPHQRLAQVVGPHTVKGSSLMEVRDGQTTVESLTEESHIRFGEDGQFVAIHNNSADYGREAIYVDGWLYLRPRFGKYHKRRPNSEAEPHRITGEVFGTMAAQLELVAGAIAVEDGGATEVAGRKARRIAIRRADRAEPVEQQLAQRTWRESAVVEALSGQLVLDAETGAPLAGKLDADVSFEQKGRTLVMHLESTLAIEPGAGGPITAPTEDQVVSDINIPHELAERESLLRGIAPPSRRPPTPESGNTP